MDNRRKPAPLFGTPLSSSLKNDSRTEDGGPVNRRQARANRQQTVLDEQGRRRFHGAFTGGFSAGYYNSVDTVQGFRPKSFSSHRRERHPNNERPSSSVFEHRPEDYMDEEDFGEFGIAPRKLRVTESFSNKPHSESIGEKILRCMSHKKRVRTKIAEQLTIPKTDYHGLGYESLCKHKSNTSGSDYSHDPLEATLKHGTRLKISGEAFGVGVLDDDEDNLSNINVYGLDKISNYEFRKSKSRGDSRGCELARVQPDPLDPEANDRYHLDGFILATDLMILNSCDSDYLKYPLPIIEASWQMPRRSEPIINRTNKSEFATQNLIDAKRQSHELSAKFVQETARLKECDIEGRAGLVPYSDLKKLESKTKTSSGEFHEHQSQAGVTISRRVIDWRPCSLLCKHFNLPNPYPDNAYFGVMPSDLSTSNACKASADEYLVKVAPMDLRKSIFNVTLDSAPDVSDESEDEPQIVVADLHPKASGIGGTANCSVAINKTSKDCDRQTDSDLESGIVLISVHKPEPELIVLSSSGSEFGHENTNDEHIDTDKEDDNTYGPPLPPTRETLQDLDRFASKSRQPVPHHSRRASSNHRLKKTKRHKVKKRAKSVREEE